MSYAYIARTIRIAPEHKRWDVWQRVGRTTSHHDLADILHELACNHGFYEVHGVDRVQVELAKCVTTPKRPVTQYRAARSTVEAIVYELRAIGQAVFEDPQSLSRIGTIAPQQSDEILYRLHELQPHWPKLTHETLRKFATIAP